jgi:hypothetical protein
MGSDWLFCVFSGASSSRVPGPPISPQAGGQPSRAQLYQAGMPTSFEASLVSLLFFLNGVKIFVFWEFGFILFKPNKIFLLDAAQIGDIGGYNRTQSPPPAHQQMSPITPVLIENFSVLLGFFLSLTTFCWNFELNSGLF